MLQKLLCVEHLRKCYNTAERAVKAVNDVSFTVEKAEYVALLGASGSGKTSVFKCISAVEEADSGRILVLGEDITEWKEDELAVYRRNTLGRVNVENNLIGTLTVYENVALALLLHGYADDEVKGKIEYMADHFCISNLLEKYPREITLLEEQKLAFVRALAGNTRIILADEPAGLLNSADTGRLLEYIQKIHENWSAALVMATHDPFAASHCDRVLFLRDGKIFSELTRRKDSRKLFFRKIMSVQSILGGDYHNAG